MSVYIGADVSKGYADFCVLTDEGEVRQQLRLDDTRRGHDRLEELVRSYAEQQDATLLVGMEATGGLELNWLHALKTLEQSVNLSVYQLNPYVLRKFVEQRLHVNKTDVSSARSIADYLRRGLAEDHTPYSDDGPSRGLRTLARKTKRMIDRSVQLKNELQALLQRAHPELVQHLRGHVSQWVLKLIREYPTPTKLLEAAPQEVAEIPYVTEAKAKRLIEAARTSVASQQDEDTGLALSLMAEDLLRLESRIGRLKEQLWDRIKDRRAPHLPGKHRRYWPVERDGPLLRDWRHRPVLIPEAVGGLRGAGSAPRAERGPTNRQEHQQAGQPPDPIDPVRVRHGCHPGREQSRGARALRPAAGQRQTPENGRGGLYAEALGHRVRLLGERSVVRPDLRGAPESAPAKQGAEERLQDKGAGRRRTRRRRPAALQQRH